ncbi:hypothetical protein ASG99_07655 [Bacillus sp. Soil768D1]|nr:hypothetical protein ASG99_07655 [Bacillus sp. Soil768D1]
MDALLIYLAISSIQIDIRRVQFLHKSWNELKNNLKDKALTTFDIQRSLSKRAVPMIMPSPKRPSKSFKRSLYMNTGFITRDSRYLGDLRPLNFKHENFIIV